MTEKASLGAVRAAKAINHEFPGWIGKTERMAVLIDRETGHAELLEALESVLQYVQGWATADFDGRPWLQNAAAAIAKARGQQ